MLQYLVIACGGALGASLRYATVTMTQTILGTRLPIGTFIVNCCGSFLIGLVMSLFIERLLLGEYWRLFIVVGFLGGYTTFSSFTWETWTLYQQGQWPMALLNFFLTNLMTFTATFLGIQLGRS